LIFEQVLLCEHIEVKKRMVGIRKRISKTPTGGRTRNASPALCMPSEGLVSPLNLLELLLCVRIGRVAVRMVLHGKRSVGFPDFFLRCPKRDSQDLVWRQLFAHGRRNIASTFLSLSALEGKLMVFPHSPSVVEYANILVTNFPQLQSQLRTQVTILPITIGHNQSLFGQLRQDPFRHLVKISKRNIEGTLDVAFLVMVRGPGIDKNGRTGQKPIFCFVERDQDVLAELQCDPRFRGPVPEERDGIGADLVREEA